MLNIHDKVTFTKSYEGGPELDKKYVYIGSGKFSGAPWSLKELNDSGAIFEIVFDSIDYCKRICELVDMNPNYLEILFTITNDYSFKEIATEWWQNTICGSSVSLWSLLRTCITFNHNLRGELLNFEIPKDALQTSRVLGRSRYSI